MNNNKMKTVLVDDDVKATLSLVSIIDHYCPEIEVVAKFDAIDPALAYLSEHNIDLLLLDIKVESNRTGFEMLDMIGTFDFTVVFITAYNDFAYKAFKYNAIHYLLKPVFPNDLVEVVNRIKNFQKMQKKYGSIERSRRVFPIVNKEQIQLINLDDIEFVEAKGSYIQIHLFNNMYYTQSKNLKHFEQYIGDDPNFLRIHRSYLINLKYIQKISNIKDNKIVMKSGVELLTTLTNKELLRIIINNED